MAGPGPSASLGHHLQPRAAQRGWELQCPSSVCSAWVSLEITLTTYILRTRYVHFQLIPIVTPENEFDPHGRSCGG